MANLDERRRQFIGCVRDWGSIRARPIVEQAFYRDRATTLPSL
jgi:hypothetical protein